MNNQCEHLLYQGKAWKFSKLTDPYCWTNWNYTDCSCGCYITYNNNEWIKHLNLSVKVFTRIEMNEFSTLQWIETKQCEQLWYCIIITQCKTKWSKLTAEQIGNIDTVPALVSINIHQ